MSDTSLEREARSRSRAVLAGGSEKIISAATPIALTPEERQVLKALASRKAEARGIAGIAPSRHQSSQREPDCPSRIRPAFGTPRGDIARHDRLAVPL